MKDLRFYLRVRNNRLVTLREQLGKTAPEIAAAIGLSYGSYIAIESLRQTPLTKGGTWKEVAVKVATFYGTSCEELWPGIMRYTRLTKAVEWQMDTAAISAGGQRHLLPPSETLDQEEQAHCLMAAIKSLPARSAEILCRRYGIGEFKDPQNYDEIACALSVSRERVRQIERRAIEQLRSPQLLRREGEESLQSRQVLSRALRQTADGYRDTITEENMAREEDIQRGKVALAARLYPDSL